MKRSLWIWACLFFLVAPRRPAREVQPGGSGAFDGLAVPGRLYNPALRAGGPTPSAAPFDGTMNFFLQKVAASEDRGRRDVWNSLLSLSPPDNALGAVLCLRSKTNTTNGVWNGARDPPGIGTRSKAPKWGTARHRCSCPVRKWTMETPPAGLPAISGKNYSRPPQPPPPAGAGQPAAGSCATLGIRETAGVFLKLVAGPVAKVHVLTGRRRPLPNLFRRTQACLNSSAERTQIGAGLARAARRRRHAKFRHNRMSLTAAVGFETN